MNLLLDTHALLWALFDPGRLSKAAHAAIGDPTHAVFVSAVSPYEIEWKQRNGRISIPGVPDWARTLESASYLPLAVTLGHAQRAARLDVHHRDPWDRLIAAQAEIENMTLVTRDAAIGRYGVATLW